MMEQVRTEPVFAERINQDLPTAAVFKADWCKDCHYIEPFMPNLEEKYKEKLHFIHIDRDDMPELCEKYNILGIPSFIVFSQGSEITRFVSKLRKTREEIEEYLDRSLAVAKALNVQE